MSHRAQRRSRLDCPARIFLKKERPPVARLTTGVLIAFLVLAAPAPGQDSDDARSWRDVDIASAATAHLPETTADSEPASE